MYGRGSTDDKGPVLGWLNVLEAHFNQGLELPVNMRFCFEAMEESSSEGLDDFIAKEAAKGDQGWFDMVDCVCIVRFPVLCFPFVRGLNIFLSSRTTTGSTRRIPASRMGSAASCMSMSGSLVPRPCCTQASMVGWCTSR